MAKKEGSVAPKERVNIVYKTYVGDAEEEIELPFRFLVVGDFTGEESSTQIEKRPLVGVDKDNFDEVMESQEVKLNANVPNELAGKEGEELGVSLNFKQLKDFSPDAVSQQVPELKALVELRDALKVLKGPLGNVPAFRKRLQAIVDDPAAQKRLLDELDLSLGGKKPGGSGDDK